MIDLNDERLTYKMLESHLKQGFKDGFELFPNSQVSLQLASMVNYRSILFPLIERVSKKGVVEIGGYQGNHLKELNSLSKQLGVKLHSVDPNNKVNDDKLDEEYSNVKFYNMTSKRYLLEHKKDLDVYIIDGDHNYETVSFELEILLNDPCVNLIVLHDTSWPCRRVDTFYSKEEMETVKEAASGYMQLQHDKSDAQLPFYWDVEFDTKSELEYAEATHENGGAKSGVYTAVEDSLSKTKCWDCVSITSIYGLTILVRKNLEVSQEVNYILEHFKYMKKFFDILEFNRLMLISRMYHQGLIWQDCQNEISRLNKVIEELKTEQKD